VAGAGPARTPAALRGTSLVRPLHEGRPSSMCRAGHSVPLRLESQIARLHVGLLNLPFGGLQPRGRREESRRGRPRHQRPGVRSVKMSGVFPVEGPGKVPGGGGGGANQARRTGTRGRERGREERCRPPHTLSPGKFTNLGR
jgi:hypothetical protein